MAEQFLDSPDVVAIFQQMRRKGVAQRVRGRRRRQTQRGAQPFHGELNDAGRERTAFGAAEQTIVAIQGIGTEFAVAIDRGNGYRQHRHDPFFAPLAGDAQHIARNRWGVLHLDPERLRDPQSGAVKQKQNGRVAGGHPIEVVDHTICHHLGRLSHRQWFRHGMRYLR
jgi:hypothetical protein